MDILNLYANYVKFKDWISISIDNDNKEITITVNQKYRVFFTYKSRVYLFLANYPPVKLNLKNNIISGSDYLYTFTYTENVNINKNAIIYLLINKEDINFQHGDTALIDVLRNNSTEALSYHYYLSGVFQIHREPSMNRRRLLNPYATEEYVLASLSSSIPAGTYTYSLTGRFLFCKVMVIGSSLTSSNLTISIQRSRDGGSTWITTKTLVTRMGSGFMSTNLINDSTITLFSLTDNPNNIRYRLQVVLTQATLNATDFTTYYVSEFRFREQNTKIEYTIPL